MKYNVFEKQKDLEVRNAQIVYLSDILGMSATEISNFVDLTISTIRRYIHKFANLLTKAKEWFGQVSKSAIAKAKEKCKSNSHAQYENCTPKDGYCSYIIEYFDNNNNFLFLKVGMTNSVERRIEEHFRDYRNNPEFENIACARVKEIHYAKNNSEENAEILESLYRQHYKALPDCGFIRRDRFTNVRYNGQDLLEDNDLMTKVRMFEMA